MDATLLPKRFANVTPSDTAAFCASVSLGGAYGILAGLDELGLVLNVANN